MKRSLPYVKFYESNEDTFVLIRQFVYSDYNEGSPPTEIKMTLLQFRSLMFHLRALDSQFTQGSKRTNRNRERSEENEKN